MKPYPNFCFNILTNISVQVNNDPNLLPNITLDLKYYDTKGETVLATKAMTELICEGVSAFFGPEGSCHVEAIISQARNIPMISYVSKNYKKIQLWQI